VTGIEEDVIDLFVTEENEVDGVRVVVGLRQDILTNNVL